jgi:riboflavin kinase, archaea type
MSSVKVLRGRVTSGTGNFSYWIERLSAHYERKTGMLFFPGTLNVQLDHPYSVPAEVIRLEKEEYGGTVSVSIVPCRVFGRAAFILRPDRIEQGQSFRPRSVVEIACDVKLREVYGLEDGDMVEIELPE